MRKVRADLVSHVGGKPSATQRALIDRAAWLSLYVARLDGKAFTGGGNLLDDHLRPNRLRTVE